MGRIVTSLFLAFVLAISPLPVDAVAGIAFADGDTGAPATVAYVAEEFDVIQDRVTYTCETAVDGTAEIACISAESGVTKVSVPASIEHEGQAYKVTSLRFSGGTTAEDVEQLLLPDTLEKLSGWNFSKFVKVKELRIPGSIKNFSCTLQNAGALEKLIFDEGVEEISANSMVNGCASLSEINLPSTLKLISGTGAFSGAESLKSITLPEGVVIDDTVGSLLSDCASLTSVSLPASVTKISSNMFGGCTSLKSVSAAGPIDSIEDGAFRDCSNLTDIDFQGTLTSIGSSAFQGCASLERLPDLSSVTEMGSSAFYECKKLQAPVNLSSLESIPAYAFCYTPVTVVGFCDNLKNIDKWAFIWSTIAAPFPETLEKIGDYVFYSGTLPEHLVIPNFVTSIGASAFSNTDGVQDVTIGSGLTQIPAGLFDDSSVKSITIDNSMDDITGTNNLPSSGVEVTYTRESIDDSVGDTVSSDSAQTLQEAINAAPDGEETVISLKKHVKLSSTLKVPAGKKIKITSDDPYTISAIKSGFSGLVDVAEGASLEISGKVSLCGSYSKGAIVSGRGSVVLSGDAVVCHGAATSVNTGIINLSGNNASFVMTGGVIERCELDDVYCGVVHAANGAKVVMKGGVIRSNRVAPGDSAGNYLSSTGVMLMGNASFDMSGGRIEGNTGYQGSAVVMYSEDNNQRASFKMTGGKIADNKSAKLGNRTPSGAVHVEGNAEFAMESGEITGNAAASDGGKGGGVCVVDHGLQNGGKDHTAFTMKGGSISGNSASAGGGIYTYSDDVTLSAGEIKGNAAWNMGGGVYGEGNEHLVYSTLHIENALVVGNHASKQGGGMWFCPTGDAKVYVQDGGLIAGNTADEAGDDVVFTGSEGAKYKLTLADRAPGGGKVLWYRDGGLFNPDGTIAATNPDVPRFAEGGNNGEPLSFTDATPNVALKSVMSDEVYNLGSGQTSLTITGNKAPHGGGIGANGGVIIGKSENISIPVKKVWENPKIPHPEEVTINLKNGGAVIDSITLSEGNDWEGAFSNLPRRDASGAEIEYTVAEDAVEGYSSAITGDAQGGFTVTNTSTATVNVPVEKKWVGPAAGEVTVSLKRGDAVVGTLKLNESNGWKASFEGLPKYDASGSEIEYTVAEDAVEGYSSAITGDAQGGFTVTNTSTATVNVPVEKKWVGPAAGEVTVSLKRGDAVVGTLKLNESNGWKASFEGLPKYDAQTGEEIEYSVAEEPVEGYDSSVSGDAQGGFTVTNTSTAKVDVPVEKKWVGPAAEKATVSLLAGGQDAGKSVELNESNGWRGAFEGLPKYDASGSEIEYSVAEDAVEGYSSAITGDAQGGFTVTNTYVGETGGPSSGAAGNGNTGNNGTGNSSVLTSTGDTGIVAAAALAATALASLATALLARGSTALRRRRKQG